MIPLRNERADMSSNRRTSYLTKKGPSKERLERKSLLKGKLFTECDAAHDPLAEEDIFQIPPPPPRHGVSHTDPTNNGRQKVRKKLSKAAQAQNDAPVSPKVPPGRSFSSGGVEVHNREKPKRRLSFAGRNKSTDRVDDMRRNSLMH